MISREEATATLKRLWKTDELKFYGEFFRPKREDGTLIKPRKGETAYGFFRNLLVNDHKIFYPKDGKQNYDRAVSFQVNVVDGIVDGKYYWLELELADDENRIENPYALKIQNIFILEEDHLSPKDFIKEWFYKKGHTPGDASTIAGQLKLNELELYTHTKRFIFELLQNADDMPLGKNDVNVEIHLLKNYLLFLHNGKFFDREDVKAISDAAKSTKSKVATQTGYKGIGFKSVFTDSYQVFIKSGSYSFKFNKLEPVYKNFNLLYQGYYNKLTPKAKKEFELEFKGKEQLYTDIDKIPWQIKPIWVEWTEVPEELRNSSFANNHQVAIALEIGESIIQQKNYNEMILGLLKEPRFLLFLRNTRKLKYSQLNNPADGKTSDISIAERNDIMRVLNGTEEIAAYLKHEFTVNIDNDDFKKAGLNFQRREIDGGKVEFFDTDGRKLENIPEKLGHLNRTVISLSAKVDKYSIEKLTSEESILFNYLPTSDQRFGFPFLVNADFVSKSDREFIQIENKWNHYLFYHIGLKCIEWIAHLGSVTHAHQEKRHFTYAKTYLNLLPQALLDEQNEELHSINKSFNQGFKEALNITSFILTGNGKLKKCDEVIIDDTSISSLLGSFLFKKLTGTTKDLPHFLLNTVDLKKDYLNIERYNAEKLIKQLEEKENKILLADTLKKYTSEDYVDFLKWLDRFCELNKITSNWLLDMPIIRLKASVVSINEALTRNGILIKTAKTKDIECLATRLGYELTEFYLDDYKHLSVHTLQTDTYLNKDLKIYERIAANNQLSKLAPVEKNTLLTFLKTLDQVGQTKYAETLALFKSKRKENVLKPLSRLISNSCNNIPSWLIDFVIDTTEEAALSDIFKKHLIQQNELLPKFFCNSELFDEVKTRITADKVESFYTYLLVLHKAIPEGTILNYTNIPWLYVPKTNSFSLPATIYCPDKLAETNKKQFESIKLFYEATSEILFPHYASLPIVRSFSLGCLKTATITKEAIVDMETANDFLDWVTNKSFLEALHFSKHEEKFQIRIVKGVTQYYTTNQDLIKLIEAHAVTGKLALLPKELYTDKRGDIGLLEKEALLTFLLDNGFATKPFVKFIDSSQDDTLKRLYVEKLPIIELDSKKTYDKNTDEHKIFQTIIDLGKDDETFYNGLANKITIDGQELHQKNVSDNVIFKFVAKDNLPERKFVLRLSEILPRYKDETAALTTVVENFTDLKAVGILRAKIFKAADKNRDSIYEEIHSSESKYLTPYQIFYLLLYKEDKPASKMTKGKPDFDTFYFNNDSVTYEALSIKMINILFEHNYFYFASNYNFVGLDLPSMILENSVALDSEKLPKWTFTWLNDGEKEKKKTFLMLAGLNCEDSPVVILRRGLLENNFELFEKGRVNIDNSTLLGNTVNWLSDAQNTNDTVLTKAYLQPLYRDLATKNVPFKNLVIPVLKSYDKDSYKLTDQVESNKYHTLNSDWGKYGEHIFNSIIKLNELVIDDVIPSKYRGGLKSLNAGFDTEPDSTALDSKSDPFDEDFYTEWGLKDQYPIFIYKGIELPFQIKYDTHLISTINSGNEGIVAKKYYVTENQKADIMPSLKRILPPNAYESLLVKKAEVEEKQKREQFEINYSDEETAALKRLFGDAIPTDFHKDLNLAALVAGLIVLPKMGYSISEAEENLKHSHKYSQLEPVYANGSEVPLTIMGRSARNGLLHLTAKAWDRLDQEDVYLFVSTGKREFDHHLFQDKQSVLNISDTDFQVFRVSAESHWKNTDAILNGTFDRDKIWLILKMKENDKYNSIFDEGIKRNEESPTYDNVGSHEDSPY